jgi:hypothetical protein
VFDNSRLHPHEARRIAVNIARPPDLLISKPGIVEQDVADE